MNGIAVVNSFSLLTVDESDSDGPPSNVDINKNVAKANKKKTKKKKTVTAKNEDLRSLAFAGGKNASRSNNSSAKKSDTQKSQRQWEEWSEKDQTYTETAYEDDLQQALLQSKLEFEEVKTVVIEPVNGHNDDNSKNKKKKKQKEKSSIMTLEEFNKLGKPKPEPEETVPEFMPASTKLNTHIENPEPAFFDDVKEDAAKIIIKEKIHEEYTKQFKVSSVQQQLFERIVSEKDTEISDLKQENKKLTSELLEVKKRCQVLCKILAHGEMKEKSEILKELEELQSIRNDLTEEVSRLTTDLEKVRSGADSKKNKKNFDKKHVTINDSAGSSSK